MIISDKYCFAFIHIPKCAGTSIRRKLEKYDDMEGMFSYTDSDKAIFYDLDMAHIPLFVLAERFPDEFLRISAYNSFALLRDPYKRFASSVTQKINMYGRKKLHEMRENEILDEISSVIDFLSKNDAPETLVPKEYIHFQRQYDYIYFRKALVVGSVYPVEKASEMLSEAMNVVDGDEIDVLSESGHLNKSFLYKNSFYKALVKVLAPVARKTVPGQIFDSSKEIVKRIALIERDEKAGRLFESEEVKEFVASYYKKDVCLYRCASEGKALPKTL